MIGGFLEKKIFKGYFFWIVKGFVTFFLPSLGKTNQQNRAPLGKILYGSR